MMNRFLIKITAAAAAGVLALSLAACGQSGKTESTAAESTAAESTAAESTAAESKAEESKAESSTAESLPEESTAAESAPVLVGGWAVNTEDTGLSAHPDAQAAFEKAVEGAEGTTYEPAALLSSQVVAGVNYCFLARKLDAAPEAQPVIELVYVYADLSGGAQILKEEELVGEVIPGSFAANTGDLAFGADETVKNAFEKAAETLLGVNYEPIAYLAKQIVNGSNYMVLCRTTVVSPDAVPEFALVTIYEDLQGNAKFGESEPLRIGLN